MAKLSQLEGSGTVRIRYEGNHCLGFPPWSQNAVAVVAQTPQLLKTQLLARSLFLSIPETEPVIWAPPLSQPHLSLAYGTDPSRATELPMPPEFEATHIALIQTDPPTLEGVGLWRELAR